MEKPKNKHDHSFTDKLKAIIFATFMLLPFMAVGTTSLYAIFNPNAYESYYGETIEQKQEVNTEIENCIIGQTYKLITPNTNVYERQQGNTEITAQNVIYDGRTTDVTQIRFYVNVNTTELIIQGLGTNDSFIYTSTNSKITTFEYYGINNEYYEDAINTILYKTEYNNQSYLDNTFYYAINQVEEQPLFSWAKNTGIYQVINATTTGLGATSNFIPVTITYMTIVTLIYIIFDIVIECFVTITHAITGNKN